MPACQKNVMVELEAVDGLLEAEATPMGCDGDEGCYDDRRQRAG